jgi:hypothetical protein
MAISIRRLAGAAAALILAGCGGGGSGSGGGVTNPPFPYVSSFVPAPQSTGIAIDPVILARFSEVMDPSTVTPGSFLMSTAAGPVPGDVALLAGGEEASFTPLVPLDYQTVYTITCSLQMRSAAGPHLMAIASSNFTTLAAPPPPPEEDLEWTVPLLLDDTDGIDLNGGYDIEIDDSGSAIAVWVRTDAGVRRVIASRSEAGGPWEDPTPIPGSDGTSTTAVADIGGSAEILVVWASGDRLWASRAGTSGDWTDPEPVGDVLDDMPTPRHVFMDPGGNAVVIYHVVRSGQQLNNVYAIRYDAADDEWEAVVDLPTSHWTDPAFAGEPSGTIVGVWSSLDDNRIIARRYTPSGGWSDDEILDPNPNDSPVYLPFVTLDGGGNAVAVWMRRIFGSAFAGMNDMYMSRMDSSGDWTDLELVPVGGALYPQFGGAALSPDGRAAITWRSSQRCWAIVQDSSGDWNEPATVDNGPAQGDAQGFPFFSWEQVVVIGSYKSDPNLVWTNRSDPDDGWEGSVLYRTTSGYLNGSTQLEMECAIDHAGSAAVFWKESTTAGVGGIVTLWVARYPVP